MVKNQSLYVCSSCGAESSTWSGKCHTCGEWNTLEETVSPSANAAGKGARGTALDAITSTKAVQKTEKRLPTGIKDIDTVLGSGIVPGSVLLLAGEPGIGKSTILLQLANAVASGHDVLYVSGEESVHQIGIRGKRLHANNQKLHLASGTVVEDITASIQTGRFSLVVVDSIQTIATSRLSSSAGSVSQITSCTHMLMQAAKQTNTALLLVGHVTKEGSIAGPKLLEHIVDTVLQLEGDRYGGFKVLRSVKNRFGSTNEVAILEMHDDGLRVIDNPSKALLSERQITDGSVVLATMEGSRPLLVEVQALVNTTSYGYPKRTASGIDINRINLLVAMLERRTKLSLSDKDIYINIVGGIRITEPAADLAVCMAIGSASKGMQLKKNAVVFGEVGLSGEVRHVPYVEKRVKEAQKLGLEIAIGPRVSKKTAGSFLHSVRDVRSALNTFLET